MKYLILGAPFRDVKYRGVSRSRPGYTENIGDDHPANKAFYWLLEEGGELRLIQNLTRAKDLVHVYANMQEPRSFEIIGITDRPPHQADKHTLLGFDVADNSYDHSALEYFFIDDPLMEADRPKDDLYWKIVPLIKLMQTYFGPLLNETKLFADIADATFFLSCFESLRNFVPSYWENPAIHFQILGLWKLPEV